MTDDIDHRVEKALAPLTSLPPPDAALVDDVMARIGPAQNARAPRMVFALGGFGAVAAFALVLVIVTRDDDFTARGGGSERALHAATVYRVDASGPEPLANGMTVTAPLRTAVALDARSNASHALVYARDARGRVTFLAPSFTDPSSTASAVALGDARVLRDEGVIVDELAPGALDIFVVLLDRALPVREADALLDGAGAEAAALPGFVSVERLTVRVSP